MERSLAASGTYFEDGKSNVSKSISIDGEDGHLGAMGRDGTRFMGFSCPYLAGSDLSRSRHVDSNVLTWNF